METTAPKQTKKSLAQAIVEGIATASQHLNRHGRYAKLEVYKDLLTELEQEVNKLDGTDSEALVQAWKLRAKQLDNALLFKVAGAIERRDYKLLSVWATVLISGKLYGGKPTL